MNFWSQIDLCPKPGHYNDYLTLRAWSPPSLNTQAESISWYPFVLGMVIWLSYFQNNVPLPGLATKNFSMRYFLLFGFKKGWGSWWRQNHKTEGALPEWQTTPHVSISKHVSCCSCSIIKSIYALEHRNVMKWALNANTCMMFNS